MTGILTRRLPHQVSTMAENYLYEFQYKAEGPVCVGFREFHWRKYRTSIIELEMALAPFTQRGMLFHS